MGETLLQKSMKGWPDIQKVLGNVGVWGTRQGQKEDLPRLMRTGLVVSLFLFAAKCSLSELGLGLALIVTT